MSDRSQTIAEQITTLVEEKQRTGEYVTVRAAAKVLNVKQTEIKDNLPAGASLVPARDGTLSSSQISLIGGEIINTEQEHEEFTEEITTEDLGSEPNKGIPADQESSAQAQDPNYVHSAVPGSTAETRVKAKKVKAPKVVALDADGNEIPAEPDNREVCVVCGNPLRTASETVRGLCPLCFRQLSRNSGLTAPKILALTEEEFQVLVGKELGTRSNLEEYKNSRMLTVEQFAEMRDTLLPVKEVFAAAKEAGYGPGRVAQAMGGDRFRHEPLKGFGSVWTPYFVGPRKGWYFDRSILTSFDDLKRPERAAKVKADGSEKDPTATRTGARGSKMKAVPVAVATPTTPPSEPVE